MACVDSPQGHHARLQAGRWPPCAPSLNALDGCIIKLLNAGQRLRCAVMQGIKNAVPKTILQLMNVEGMTRENVASHLQKYRLHLKRSAGYPADARLSPDDLQRLQQVRHVVLLHCLLGQPALLLACLAQQQPGTAA